MLTRKLMKKNSYNSETRTVQAVAATESPVEVFDWERGIIREVLLMSGCELPDQVPVLDSHDRFSVGNVLGSATGFNIVNDEMQCTVELSKESRADGTALKIEEGHLTDLSIGYEILRGDWIDENQTKFYGAKSIEGPVRVATQWRIKELSICPIGADARAKIRSYQGVNKMPENTTIQKTEAEIRAEERERVQEITACGHRMGCPEIAKQMVDNGADLAVAMKRMLDFTFKMEAATEIPNHRVELGADAGDKRSDAMIDGLVIRAGFNVEKPAPGANEYIHASIMDIAKQSLFMAGKPTRGLSTNDILKNAMSMRTHTTSDFPYILANVGNKILRNSYENAPSTFQLWTVKGFGTDFKEMSRVQISEAPDLDIIPEAVEYKYGTFGESREVFQIVKHGKMFKISYEAMKNDDLGAFTRTSRAFVSSAKRGLNARVYKELTDNAAMSDGTALFHEDHGNLAGSGAAISIGTLTAARLAIRTQSGLQTDDPLNILPRYLIVPAALETEADQVLNTMEGYDATDGPGVRNPFYKKLIVIPEPWLDTVDDDAWYVTADPRQFDTIEVAYLDGNENPYLEQRQGWEVDAWEFKIRFEYGVKALDWRGLYKNPGAGN